MFHRLAICLVIASTMFVAPRPAASDVTHVFNAVDAVEVGYVDVFGGSYRQFIKVTGILTGATAQTTLTYLFDLSASTSSFTEIVNRCERFALIAISKPGKFQFAIGGGELHSGCKLTRIAP